MSCSYVILLFYQGGKVIILNFSFTYFLAVSSFLRIQTRPDQSRPYQTRTRLDWIRLDLCSIRTLAIFFKVESISLFLQIIYLCTSRCLGFVMTPSLFLYHTWSLTRVQQMERCQEGSSQPWPTLITPLWGILDLGQLCRLADWSIASSTYLRFYKCYI